MSKQKKNIVQKLCRWVGAGLLITGGIVLIAWQWGISASGKQAQNYVDTLRRLMPTPQSAVPEARRDNTMAVLPLDGTDFVGILELPAYASVLPVGAQWGSLTRYPCCFSGSVYDGTLQIGGTSQRGQYDFYREISVGDTVYFTDMEGNRYTYAVTDLRYEKHADQAALQREDAALTLFIKNVYAFEYLIVYCNTPE